MCQAEEPPLNGLLGHIKEPPGLCHGINADALLMFLYTHYILCIILYIIHKHHIHIYYIDILYTQAKTTELAAKT